MKTYVFKIPDEMQRELAASIAMVTLTPYRALKQATLKINEFLVMFGASGNTDMILGFGVLNPTHSHANMRGNHIRIT